MITKIDVEDLEQAKRILDVQIPSYLVEAERIGFYDIPPLKDTLDTLQQCGETFYGYVIEGELAGAISYKIEGTTLDIHRMIVHPRHFRKGIARELLQFVQKVAPGVTKIVVSTGAKNVPAKHLYLQAGFRETGEREVVPGLSLSFFEKVLL